MTRPDTPQATAGDDATAKQKIQATTSRIPIKILKDAPPDLMNHLETAPRLYKEVRPGSDYQFSLNLLKKFKALFPHVPTKSGMFEAEAYKRGFTHADQQEHGVLNHAQPGT